MDSNSKPSNPSSNCHQNLPNLPLVPLRPPPASEHPIPDNEDADEAYFKALPAGYRFYPTDYELIISYLQKRINGEPLPRNMIKEVNLYSQHPEKLIEMYKKYGEDEWYFFSPRFKKYPKGQRPRRSADDGSGFWKATGTDKKIFFPRGTKNIIGGRNALVFYEGKASNGTKTDWILHEYLVNISQKLVDPNNRMLLDPCVLCKIYKNTRNRKRKRSGDDDDDDNDGDDNLEPEIVDGDDEDDDANDFANNVINEGPNEGQNDGDHASCLTNGVPPFWGSMKQQVPYFPEEQQFPDRMPNYPPPRPYNVGNATWSQYQSIGMYNNVPPNYYDQIAAATRNFNCMPLGHDPYIRMVPSPYNISPSSNFMMTSGDMPLGYFDQDLGQNMVQFQNVMVPEDNNLHFGPNRESDEQAMKKNNDQIAEPETRSTSRSHSPTRVTDLANLIGSQ